MEQFPSKTSLLTTSPVQRRVHEVLSESSKHQQEASERSNYLFEMSLQQHYITRVDRLKLRLITEQDYIANNAYGCRISQRIERSERVCSVCPFAAMTDFLRTFIANTRDAS